MVEGGTTVVGRTQPIRQTNSSASANPSAKPHCTSRNRRLWAAVATSLT